MTIDEGQLRAAGEQLGFTTEELDVHVQAIQGLTTAFTLCAMSSVIRPQETENQIRELCHEDATNLALGGVMVYIELLAEHAEVKARVEELEAQLARLN